VDAIKSKLGIASPSKVLFRVGKWTGQGLINGVGAMTREASRAMADLVSVPSAPRIPLQGVTGTTGTTPGRSVEQHVHVHVDGAFIGDRIGLAREIERLLSDRHLLVTGGEA
jgi:hypothetical protein